MRNIKLTLEYDGTAYCGWQVQKSHHATKTSRRPSIQETIEQALHKIIQERIKLIGSGRTDAGVHAEAQVVNFKTASGIAVEKLQKALNALLPDDIVVTKAENVDLDFHSRFHVKTKEYRYAILNRAYPSALLKDKAYFHIHPLNLKLMRTQANLLLGRHDFKAFQASGKKKVSTIRIIKKIKITKNKDLIYIDIEANGFLYNMVRNIVGTLIEIGRGKMPPNSMRRILLAKDRRLAGPKVAACGLCLRKVKYIKDT